MENEPLKFGLWGGSESGKTTYLSALHISTLQMIGKRNWTIAGDDLDSIEMLLQWSNELRKNGTFQPPTKTPQFLSFYLEGSVDESGRSVRIKLDVVDMPGEYFSYIHREDNTALLEHLAVCNGLILFLKDDKTDLQMLSLNIIAMQQRRRLLAPNSNNQKVAVCLVQYDEAKLFQKLIQMNLIETRPYKGILTPMVKDEKRAIRECIDDGGVIIKTLEGYFGANNIEYFAISSIGFHNLDDGRIDLSNCKNVAETPQGRKIVSGSKLLPVNVWTPIAWLAGATKRSSRS